MNLFPKDPLTPRLAGMPASYPAGHTWLGYLPYRRRAATMVIVLMFGLFIQRPAISETVEEQAATHFRAGQAAFQQGDLTQAAKEFKKVLELDPRLVEARVNLGLVYHALGELQSGGNNLS